MSEHRAVIMVGEYMSAYWTRCIMFAQYSPSTLLAYLRRIYPHPHPITSISRRVLITRRCMYIYVALSV